MSQSHPSTFIGWRAGRGLLATTMLIVGMLALPAGAHAAKSVPAPVVSEIGVETALVTIGAGVDFDDADMCAIRVASAPGDSFDYVGVQRWDCDAGGAVPVTGLSASSRYAVAVVQCNNYANQDGRQVCMRDAPGFVEACAVADLYGTCTSFTTRQGPQPTTSAVSNITARSARVSGIVNVLDLGEHNTGSMRYAFQYSTSADFAGARTTTAKHLPGGIPSWGDFAVSDTITGLTPGTLYYYRLYVLGDSEYEYADVFGPGVSFETPGAVRALPVTKIEPTTATFNGLLSTEGSAVSYHWLLGTDAALGAGAVQRGPGTVGANTSETVSFNATGLTPGLTYYVALVAGGVRSEAVRFTAPLAQCSDPTAAKRSNHAIGSTGLSVTGCWKVEQGVHIGQGPVTVNGLRFDAPVNGFYVRINPSTSRITATSGYEVGLGPVPLYLGAYAALDVKYETKDGASTFQLPQVPAGSKLYGLAVGGITTVTTTDNGGASVHIAALNLPSVLAEVNAQVTVDIDHSGLVGAVEARAGAAKLGKFSFPDLTLTYDIVTNKWTGLVWFQLPKADANFSGTVTIQNGRLVGIGGAFDDVLLGVFPGMRVTGGNFYTLWHPNFILEGLMKFEVGSQAPPVLNGEASFNLTLDGDHTINHVYGIPDGTKVKNVPVYVQMGGLARIGEVQVGSAQVRYYGMPNKPFAAINGRIQKRVMADCPISGTAGIDPALDVAISANSSAFNLYGEGSVTAALCFGEFKVASAQTLASSAGLAACGNVLGVSVGFGGEWPLDKVKLYATGGCNVGQYSAPLVLSRTRRDGTGAQSTVRIPAGLPSAIIKVEGKGGAVPIVQVTGPGGLKITMPSTPQLTGVRGRWVAIPDGTTGTSFINIKQPKAGTYRVTALGGSIVTKVSVAHEEPAPRVTAKLRSAKGGTRTLTWSARQTPRQRIVLRELGPAGERTLVKTTRLKGSVTFTPRRGVAGTRSIVAEVYKYGKLAYTKRVASYRGPVLRAPGRSSRVTITRRGATATVRWRASRPAARTYEVRVTTADGRKRMFTTRRTALTLRKLPVGAVTARVTGVSEYGRRGKARSATSSNVRVRLTKRTVRAKARRAVTIRYTARTRTPIRLEVRRGKKQLQYLLVKPRRAGANTVRISAPKAAGTYTLRLHHGTTRLHQGTLRVTR